MLGKLIKHEFRATARLMLPLFLVVILLSAFTRLTTGLVSHTPDLPSVLRILNGLLVAGFVLSLIVVSVFSVVLMVSRFYRNLMTDEGYLMFTLPASIHQLLWSKLIVSAVWFIATFLIDALGILIAAYQGGMLRDILNGFGSFFRELNGAYGFDTAAFLLEVLVLVLLALIVSCLNFYAPIAIGHSFAGHKILLSVVFYFAIGIAWQIIGVFAGAGGINLLAESFSYVGPETIQRTLSYVHGGMLTVIGAMAFVGAVMYFVTWIMLKKRLNLQ